MIAQHLDLDPGLYFVATPIGTARDITLRALDILLSADVLAAEDTRSLRRLMELHSIPLGDRPLIAYHDHNGARIRPKLLAELASGRSVAYASEAGMPLIADPGFALSLAVQEAGHPVTCAPGASALTTALALAGQPTDRFLFEGFLPNAKGQRKTALTRLSSLDATLVFYESPKRLAAMLADCSEILGANRPATVCRELTKKFEEVQRGSISELASVFGSRPAKGEIVVVIGRPVAVEVTDEALKSALVGEILSNGVKTASESVSRRFGVPRRRVYQLALTMERDE